MGIYLNPGNEAFREALRSQIYVDKSGFLSYTNQVLETKQKNMCVSSPRRFGKSMMAEMLTAYYGKGCDSRELFAGLKIASDGSYGRFLNRFHVLHLDIQWFRSNAKTAGDAVCLLQDQIVGELTGAFPDAKVGRGVPLPMALAQISEHISEKFIIIVDEWDCLFREDKDDEAAQKEYLSLLRGLFKGAQSEKYVALAYLTGILPIKKYGTQSALNNFQEFTMVNPGIMARYIGFQEKEVKRLCDIYEMNFDEAKRWFDGYRMRGSGHVYSPKSVVEAMLNREFDSYWTNTETYELLKDYIEMNFDGLRDAIIEMLGGGVCRFNARTFQNDMVSLKNKDDVLTLLVHLGYLAYDAENQNACIPNREVEMEFVNAVEVAKWEEVTKSIQVSGQLLEAVWRQDEAEVARGMEEAHLETSHLQYNDENALSYTVSLALYAAREYYTVIREFPSGKGFADMVFLPRKKFSDKPALIVELKWDQQAVGAIEQIKVKQYVNRLEEYRGNLLLVGINYDKKTKKHECRIEQA